MAEGAPTEPSDDELALSARGGDARASQAFQEIVRRHQRWVLRHAARRLGNDDDAKDAAQEAFVALHRSLTNGKYEASGRFRGFLFRIVHNCCAMRQRAGATRARYEERVDVDVDTPLADAPLVVRERRQRVHTALAALPDEKRACVELFYDAGFSYQEIADALDIPINTVRSRLADALKKLRSLLHGDDA